MLAGDAWRGVHALKPRSRLRSRKTIDDLDYAFATVLKIRDWEEYQIMMTSAAQHVVVLAGGAAYEKGDGRPMLQKLIEAYKDSFVSFAEASIEFASTSGLFDDESVFVFAPRPLHEPLSEPTEKLSLGDFEKANAIIKKLVGGAQSSVRGSLTR